MSAFSFDLPSLRRRRLLQAAGLGLRRAGLVFRFF